MPQHMIAMQDNIFTKFFCNANLLYFYLVYNIFKKRIVSLAIKHIVCANNFQRVFFNLIIFFVMKTLVLFRRRRFRVK